MFKLECLTGKKSVRIQRAFCMPDEESCNPDYGIDCSPDGECGPEDGSEDPYPF